MKVKSMHWKVHRTNLFVDLIDIKNILLPQSAPRQKSLAGSYHNLTSRQREVSLCLCALHFRKSIPATESGEGQHVKCYFTSRLRFFFYVGGW